MESHIHIKSVQNLVIYLTFMQIDVIEKQVPQKGTRHSQKDRQDEKAEGYIPNEGTRKKTQENN